MARNWKWHQTEEIVAKLEHAARLMAKGASTHEGARAIGVGAATYFRWRKQYAGLKPQHVSYIRKLQQEVLRLRAAIKEHDLNLPSVTLESARRLRFGAQLPHAGDTTRAISQDLRRDTGKT